MGRKKVTSSDVAAASGVSQATVSMILNRRENVSFSRETVEKVEAADGKPFCRVYFLTGQPYFGVRQ